MLSCNTERIIKDEDVITKWFDSSQVICSCPGVLISAIFTYETSRNKTVFLYDGIDSSGKVLISVYLDDPLPPVFILDNPIRFNKGLYLALERDVVCTVQYIPDY